VLQKNAEKIDGQSCAVTNWHLGVRITTKFVLTPKNHRQKVLKKLSISGSESRRMAFLYLKIVSNSLTEMRQKASSSPQQKLPSGELAYPNLEKGTSSTQKCFGKGYVGFQGG